MKMEMSYRDKVILIVLLIVLILVAGFFALIKPKYEAYQASQAAYETTLQTWKGIEQKLNAIPPLKDSITETYNKSKKTAQIFVNTSFVTANKTYGNEKTSYEIDQYLQPAIDECNLFIKEMALDEVTAETMEYYYYEPDVLTYSLLEAADVNLEYSADVAKLLQDSVILSEREMVDLMCEPVELTVEGTKENLMLFLEKIDTDNNAVLIKGVKIDDYQFRGGLEEDQLGADGLPVTVVTDGEGYSTMTIEIAFYNAKEIDKPNLGD